jgi:hypothetical protein
MISLKRRMLAASGEEEFMVERVKNEAGVKRRYVVWGQSHVSHLEDIAHPDRDEPETCLLVGGQLNLENQL